MNGLTPPSRPRPIARRFKRAGHERRPQGCAARTGKDALRDRIDALQAQLAAAEGVSDVEMARLIAEARQAHAEAQASAEAARRAGQARRSNSLLGRLKAAWRGS
jgi:hypothetical protein